MEDGHLNPRDERMLNWDVKNGVKQCQRTVGRTDMTGVAEWFSAREESADSRWMSGGRESGGGLVASTHRGDVPDEESVVVQEWVPSGGR